MVSTSGCSASHSFTFWLTMMIFWKYIVRDLNLFMSSWIVFLCFKSVLVEVWGYDHFESNQPWMFHSYFCFDVRTVWFDHWNILERNYVEIQWRSIFGESVLKADLMHILVVYIYYGLLVMLCKWKWMSVLVNKWVGVFFIHVLKEKGRINVIVDWCGQIVLELQRFLTRSIARSCLDIWAY